MVAFADESRFAPITRYMGLITVRLMDGKIQTRTIRDVGSDGQSVVLTMQSLMRDILDDPAVDSIVDFGVVDY